MFFAVLENEQNQLTDIFQAVQIALYDQETNWTIKERKTFSKMNAESLLLVRRFGENLNTLLKSLSCNMLLGKQIVGIPFQILEKNEIIMCEIEEISKPILQTIYEDFFVNTVEKKEYTPTQPVKTEQDGFYFFDFAACQKQFPEITSKQVIIPFLQKEVFICLTLQCSHVMPWLSGYALEHGLEILEEEGKSGWLLHIRHKECA